MTLEPKDKLDAVTTQTTGAAATAPASIGTVNGPEDEVPDWHALDWRAAEDDVRRLRQRIFTASQAGDLKRVRRPNCHQGLLEPDARKRASPVLRRN
jgi:RNA-directed DNA polymerase